MPDYTQILEEVVALRAESAALRAEMDALKAALIRVEALTDAMNEELASMAGVIGELRGRAKAEDARRRGPRGTSAA